jgi:hypothetical protein
LLQSLLLKSYKSYSSERPAVGWSDWLDLLFQYRQLKTKMRTAKAQLIADVMTSVEAGRATPV